MGTEKDGHSRGDPVDSFAVVLVNGEWAGETPVHRAAGGAPGQQTTLHRAVRALSGPWKQTRPFASRLFASRPFETVCLQGVCLQGICFQCVCFQAVLAGGKAKRPGSNRFETVWNRPRLWFVQRRGGSWSLSCRQPAGSGLPGRTRLRSRCTTMTSRLRTGRCAAVRPFYCATLGRSGRTSWQVDQEVQRVFVPQGG